MSVSHNAVTTMGATVSPDHRADSNTDVCMTLAMPVTAHESTTSIERVSRGSVDLYLRKLLDRMSRQLRALDLSSLNAGDDALDQLRRDVGPTEWTRLIADVIVPHPVVEQLREEPFTRRAFEKPRGYAGDAVMLDLRIAIARIPSRSRDSARRFTRGSSGGRRRRVSWSAERFWPAKSTRWRRVAQCRAFSRSPAAISAKHRSVMRCNAKRFPSSWRWIRTPRAWRSLRTSRVSSTFERSAPP